MKKTFTPRAHLIGRGVLPVGGKCVIAGEPKANKSWVVLNIMLDLVRGRPIFGAYFRNGQPVLPVNRACKVLYLEQELGEDGLRERLSGTEGRPGLTTALEPIGLELFVKPRDTAMRLDTPEGREFINNEVLETKPDVIFGDPLTKFHLSDENSSQEMSAVLRAADHIIEDFGCAFCFVHHTGKPQFGKDGQRVENQGLNRIRGSSAIAGDIDTYIEVVRLSNEHHPEPTLRLDFTLRRGEPMLPLFVVRKRDGTIEPLPEDFQWGQPARGDTLPRGKYRSL